MQDYHSHTSFSDDCQVPMEEMILGALEKGITELAITDHFDPGYPDPNFPFLIDFPAYYSALNSMKEKYSHKIKIVKGLEVGITYSQLETCSKEVNNFDYDFIIGSFHCIEKEDFHSHDYSSDNEEEKLIEFYTYVNKCLKAYNDYDVVGHFTILDRYIKGDFSYKKVLPIIEDTLKNIIYNGKGLEINTSSFRYNMDTWLPRKEILSMYNNLGGEIITLGSDAHSQKYFLDHFADARALLENLGFKYISTFDSRKVTMDKFI